MSLTLLNFLLDFAKLEKGAIMEIGKKIKNLRLFCNLTQNELADRCELTKGYISQIENDLTSPSIATLIDILSALGTDLKEFFSDIGTNAKVSFNKNDFIEKSTEEYVINWLVPNAQKNEMEPIKLNLKPDCATDEDVPHEGEEFGYVLRGEIVLILGKRKVKVRKGESFYYKSNVVHKICNQGRQEAEFIWVSTPPSF